MAKWEILNPRSTEVTSVCSKQIIYQHDLGYCYCGSGETSETELTVSLDHYSGMQFFFELNNLQLFSFTTIKMLALNL